MYLCSIDKDFDELFYAARRLTLDVLLQQSYQKACSLERGQMTKER